MIMTDSVMIFDYSKDTDGEALDLIEAYKCDDTATVCLWEGEERVGGRRDYALIEIYRDENGKPTKTRDIGFTIADDGEHEIFTPYETVFSGCVGPN